MSAICARLSKGKVGVQRGRETAGVPSFLPSAVGTAPSPRRAPHSPALRRAQLPAEVQRKTPRPSGANPPAAVRVPRWVGAEKEPPVRGEPACGSSRAPVSRCRKGAARIGRTRLRQFVCPGQPVQKRSRPDRVEPACGSSCAPVSRCSKRSRPSGANPPAAVRVPRSAGAEKEPPVKVEPACGSSCAPVSRCRKGAARQGRTRLRQFVCPGHLVPRKEKHRRIASTVLKVCTFTQIAAAYRHPYAQAPAGPVPDDRAR